MDVHIGTDVVYDGIRIGQGLLLWRTYDDAAFLEIYFMHYTYNFIINLLTLQVVRANIGTRSLKIK